MSRPPAIVLSYVVTGLATARGLWAGGVDVHAVTFEPWEPIRFSRSCHHVDLSGRGLSDDELVDWLLEFSKRFSERPVLIPTSDAHVLLLSARRDRLASHFRMFTTEHREVLRIVSKEGLYQMARDAGVGVVPAVVEPSYEQLESWTREHPAPYFVKPYYEGIEGSALRVKNLHFTNRDELLAFARQRGTARCIVQRQLYGGDGFIFDCYGYCDATGKVVTMASHRRLRQFPPNAGTTTYGEIPAAPVGHDEAVLFENTARLLSTTRYHGIFGIEWLQDRDTRALHLIDFNARPFSSIGHLCDCSLNLPLLAYRDLSGDDLTQVEPRPALRHLFWIDLRRDISCVRALAPAERPPFQQWLRSILTCRSHAYFSLRDPGPGLYRGLTMARLALHFPFHRHNTGRSG